MQTKQTSCCFQMWNSEKQSLPSTCTYTNTQIVPHYKYLGIFLIYVLHLIFSSWWRGWNWKWNWKPCLSFEYETGCFHFCACAGLRWCLVHARLLSKRYMFLTLCIGALWGLSHTLKASVVTLCCKSEVVVPLWLQGRWNTGVFLFLSLSWDLLPSSLLTRICQRSSGPYDRHSQELLFLCAPTGQNCLNVLLRLFRTHQRKTRHLISWCY